MRSRSAALRRHGWLELTKQSGPFLTVPVAAATWPEGMPAVPQTVRATVRAAVAQLLEDHGSSRASLSSHVFRDALGWGDALVEGDAVPASLSEFVTEHGVVVRPDFAFRAPDEDDEENSEDELADEDDEDTEDEDDGETPTTSNAEASFAPSGPWRLLGMWAPWGTDPLRRSVKSGWAASPVERLAVLLRSRDVPVGLVSDGRWWALVWAPRGRPMGVAVWDADLWATDPDSFRAFVALLERRRFLGVQLKDRLPGLLDRSAQAQEEVTDTLGRQVRAAVEMLVRKLDELDRNAGGRLLDGVSDDDLYAGVVTVMMRVVFLLFAEERRLVPSDDARYDVGYSVGRLVEQLEQRAALNGEQTLEHRTGAWHRLLAVARALHGGVAHEDLRLPPYGGALFDPSRHPWLEGGEAAPPAIDDLTVLRMLRAVQFVELDGERRRLTFRALDVEQIGYVYEGLLEMEVRTATEPVLFLQPQKKGVDIVRASVAAEIVANDLHSWTASAYLGRRTASTASRRRAERLLARDVSELVVVTLQTRLESHLAETLVGFAPLLRCDERGRPMIVPTGGRYVASSTRRSTTGTHYTPRFLAEEVVKHALDPLIYRPGPLETLDETKWVLRPSTDLFALRVADIAMGSGAFLVAACRYLADRIVEAWDEEGDIEASRALAHRTVETADAEVEGVLLRARRMVAEQCLYGVDINPLAVEMAKLSLWLVTMDRERPFGFLDDRLVCGDSLLGVSSMSQLETLHMDPAAGHRLHRNTLDFGIGWRDTLARAADTRRRITATSVVTVRDVEHKVRLLTEAQTAAEPVAEIADALVGAGLRAAGVSPARRDGVFRGLFDAVWMYDVGGDPAVLEPYTNDINAGLPEGKERRRPLHWPLTFPEVFADVTEPGFDAIVGNPPFYGGQKISRAMGSDYLAALQAWDGHGVRGSADLGARFFLRADSLLSPRGQLGYVATNTLIEGDTLTVGPLQLEQRGWVFRRGVSAHKWPSKSANLSIVEIWASRAPVSVDPVLDGEPVPHMGVDLQPYLRETGRPERLAENEGIVFQGSNILGLGFTVEPSEAARLIDEDPRNAEAIQPYVIGKDLNQRPDSSASRWVINFRDWSLERAEEYPLLIERVRRLVKPERDRNRQRERREVWWRFTRPAPELYAAIHDLDHVLAISLVGNALMPLRVPTGPVFAHACAVFALNDYASVAMLSSSAHQAWVTRYTSTMRTDIRYAPSDVFLTLPRPRPTTAMEELGEALDTERRKLMLGRNAGLTKLYNRVHDPTVSEPEIVRLRDLHGDVDRAVFDAYGWNDLDPELGHHRTKIGVRWTLPQHVRFEVLDRLLVENHRRAAAAHSQ